MRKFVLLLVAVFVLGASVMPAAAQQPTIADIVVSSASGNPAEFTILLAAVQAADPAVLAALSDPNANLTVFAPTDAAFVAILGELGLTADQLLADQALVTEILLYHVLGGRYSATQLFDLAGQGWPNDYLRTLQGTFVEFTNDNGTLIVDYAWVITPDIQAANGVVHVIGAVLNPSFQFGEEGLPQ